MLRYHNSLDDNSDDWPILLFSEWLFEMPLIVRLGKISFDSGGLLCTNVANDYAPYHEDSLDSPR